MGKRALTVYALTGLGRAAIFADASVCGRIQSMLDRHGALPCKELERLTGWGDATRRGISRMLQDRYLKRGEA